MTSDRDHLEQLGHAVNDAYRRFALSDEHRRTQREQLATAGQRRGTDRLRSHVAELGAVAALVVIALTGFLVWNSLEPGSSDDDAALNDATETDVKCFTADFNFPRPPEVQDQLATQWAAEGYVDCTPPPTIDPEATDDDCVPLPDMLRGDVPAAVTQQIQEGTVYCTPAPELVPTLTTTAVSTTPLPDPTATQASLVPGDSTHERLYVVDSSGRIVGIDLETNGRFLELEVGSDSDVALSPDGMTLYVPGYAETGRVLTAYDALSGEERWRVETENGRVGYIGGYGPPTVSASPDGRFVYVYDRAPTESLGYVVAVHSAVTGEIVSSVDVPVTVTASGAVSNFCAASIWPSQSADRMLVLCFVGGNYHLYDLATGERVETAGVPTSGVTEAVVGTSDGTRLYAVSSEGDVAVYDRASLELTGIVELLQDASPVALALALSEDGTRLYVPTAAAGSYVHSPIYREIRVYDTTTWEEIERIELDFEAFQKAFNVDRAGNLYGIEWHAVSDTRVWRRDVGTGEIEILLTANSEVQQLLVVGGAGDS